MHNIKVGKNAVVLGQSNANVGDDSVVISGDIFGNVNINKGVTIGSGAYSNVPNAITIGAGARTEINQNQEIISILEVILNSDVKDFEKIIINNLIIEFKSEKPDKIKISSLSDSIRTLGSMNGVVELIDKVVQFIN